MTCMLLRSPPAEDARGDMTTPNSIATLEKVNLNGTEQRRSAGRALPSSQVADSRELYRRAGDP
jgi:hypothetical protein